jgi:hypothetical protein
MATVLRTVKDENTNNPGITSYYDDGTSSFSKANVNPQGLTTQEMIDKGNTPTPPVTTTPLTYNADGTRTVTAADKFWADNPVQTKADYDKQQAQTKADFATRQQSALDAINTMYTSILSKANNTAQDKLGSQNVMNALSGQRGSESGAANVDKVNSANDDIYQGLLAEKQAKISSIMDKNYKDQTSELQYQNDLRRKDLDSYLSYMGEKEKTDLTKSQAMRAELIKSNIGINDIDPATLKQMADNAGYSVEQFKALYEAERKTQEKSFLDNEQKRLSELAKTTAETAKLNNEANKPNDPLLSKGYIPVKNTDNLKGLTENDIIRVGDKIYRIPANLKKQTTADKLSEYETKKQIDSRYKTQKTTTSKNFNDSSIPAELKKEIITNITSGANIDDVMKTYPEVSSNYIKSLYTKPKKGRSL